jgi:thimet oligopeptidase
MLRLLHAGPLQVIAGHRISRHPHGFERIEMTRSAYRSTSPTLHIMFRLTLVRVASIAALAIPFTLVAQGAPLPAATGFNFRPTAESLLKSCSASVRAMHAEVRAVDAVPDDARNFDNTLGRVERASAALVDSAAADGLLYLSSPDSSVRAASQTCSQHLAGLSVELGADPHIYSAAVALARPGVLSDPAQRKIAELYVEQGRHAGAGLDSAMRARVTSLFNRLNDVQREYGVAIAADTTTIRISAAEAKGLPPQLVSVFKPVSGGGYIVPVNESTMGPFMMNETSSDARARAWAANFRRGGIGNVRRVEVALALRDTLATAFGFPNWATYQLDTHMAKDPNRVVTFLDQIDSRLAPKARAEMADLAVMKRESGDSSPMTASDIAYYNAMLRRTKYKVDPEEIRQYFPVDQVITGVFGIYHDLLGVTFNEISPADAWAPGVREFAVSDTKTQKPIGWIFLDLYPRPNKYDHFATFPIRPAVYWADGSVNRPVSAIIGNWPAGQPGKPALLSHGDVITFFHEFGHLMDMTLVHTPYPTLDNLRQDFVEAPSQMLENWMWTPTALARVSRNVTTGKPLPPDLIKRMIALRQLGAGYGNSIQAFLAMYDMRLHMSPVPLDTKATWDSVSARMLPGIHFTGDYPVASFGHLMGGYDAGYYGYLWSKAYAQDLFTRFEKDGVMSQSAGMAYRHDILEPGGVREPDVLLQAFLGRPLNYDAFYRSLGITGASGTASASRDW